MTTIRFPGINTIGKPSFGGNQWTRPSGIPGPPPFSAAVSPAGRSATSGKRSPCCRATAATNWPGPSVNTRTGTIPGEPTADAALRVLEQLGEFGIQQLPPRRTTIAGRRSPIVHTRASDPGEEITGTLSDLEPLSLRGADADDDRTLWRELVDRHHHLGCPHPFGSSLHWFVTDARGRRLGCLLVEAGSRQLPA
ncbi:MAG: DUF4338 domain-containing protein, partial [Rhodobacteraceae bacterium]|nr:DUF4338 domain-containing protein [Paracoccaceae bacterium]